MTAHIHSKIFNTQKTDYQDPSLFLGQDPGLADTLNRPMPVLFDLYKEVKQLDWDENEFPYETCKNDFKSCDRSTYDMMIKTLAWQWEADSVASRSIIGIMAPLISSTDVFTGWQRIADNESVHAYTYSEIVRQSFDDPSVVLDEILRVEESVTRLSSVAAVMGETHETAHKYALGLVENNQQTYNAAFMFTVAMLVLERVQFLASFAVTFTICDTGRFGAIGRAVQKIAQDEQVHVRWDKAILRNEVKTSRGKMALQLCWPKIQHLVDEVILNECEWVDYLFSNGRRLDRVTPERLKHWVALGGADVYNFFGMEPSDRVLAAIGGELPTENPLPHMNHWLDLSKFQGSPQEEKNGQYKVGVVRRDDDDEDFGEYDF